MTHSHSPLLSVNRQRLTLAVLANDRRMAPPSPSALFRSKLQLFTDKKHSKQWIPPPSSPAKLSANVQLEHHRKRGVRKGGRINQRVSQGVTRPAGEIRWFIKNSRVHLGRVSRRSNLCRISIWSNLTGRVGSGRVGSGRVGSGRVGSGRIRSGRVRSGVRRYSITWVGKPGNRDPIRPVRSGPSREKPWKN